MVLYRRNRVAGGTYFFTVTLQDRSSTLLVDHIDLLRAAYHRAHIQRPFSTLAYCVLPDHLHAVWRLPEGDANYSQRWQHIKGGFVRALKKRGIETPVTNKGESMLWQRRFWEYTVRDDGDLQKRIDYVHHNPVKHALTERASDWPHSSIHTYIARGDFTANWAFQTPDHS